MAPQIPEDERLMSPAEVSTAFRVVPGTVTRWAKSGKLRYIRTPGGHRRYSEADVRRLLESEGEDRKSVV